jgi:hypothetical protein
VKKKNKDFPLVIDYDFLWFRFRFQGSMVRSESLQSGLGKPDSKSGTQSKRGSLTSVVSAKPGSSQEVKLATAASTPNRASVYRLSAGSKTSQKKDLSQISVTWCREIFGKKYRIKVKIKWHYIKHVETLENISYIFRLFICRH